jgi:hypothetical protein
MPCAHFREFGARPLLCLGAGGGLKVAVEVVGGAMKVRRLILTGMPDDGGQLEEFCQRLASGEYAAGARLRALAVELARQGERGSSSGEAPADEGRFGRT